MWGDDLPLSRAIKGAALWPARRDNAKSLHVWTLLGGNAAPSKEPEGFSAVALSRPWVSGFASVKPNVEVACSLGCREAQMRLHITRANICFIDYWLSQSDQTSAPEKKWCCHACGLGSEPGATLGLQESVGVGGTQTSRGRCS